MNRAHRTEYRTRSSRSRSPTLSDFRSSRSPRRRDSLSPVRSVIKTPPQLWNQQWKPVKIVDNVWVSNKALVWNGTKCITPKKSKFGDAWIVLLAPGLARPLHSVVAHAFVPGRSGERRWAAHKDGDYDNNEPSNLIWVGKDKDTWGPPTYQSMIEMEKDAAARLLVAEEARRLAEANEARRVPEAQRVVLCKVEEMRRIGGELRDSPVVLNMGDRRLAGLYIGELIASLSLFSHRLLSA